MRDDRHELGARLVDGTQLLQLGLGLRVQAALLDHPREQAGQRFEEADVGGAEVTVLDRLHVEHAHHLLLPDEWHRAHGGETRLVDATDPGEAVVGMDVGTDDGRQCLRRQAGDALAHLQARHAHRVLVQAVGGSERQPAAVAVDEVERTDVRPRGRPGTIDDGAHEVVPRPRCGRQVGDVGEEGDLVDAGGGPVAR